VVQEKILIIEDEEDIAQASQAALQALGDIGQFLADRGRGRRLAVGACQHRQVGPVMGLGAEFLYDATHRRQQDLLAALQTGAEQPGPSDCGGGPSD
jgi:hypothetical protein